MRDHRDVILRPVVSEKSYKLLADNVYTFIVAPEATKPEIRAAVEAIFDVSVVRVNTLRRKGKRRHNRPQQHLGPQVRHQTRPDHAGRGRLDRSLRGLTWRSASASPPAPAADSRPRRTSPRSPAHGLSAACSSSSRGLAAATISGARRPATAAAATSSATARSTSFAPRTTSQRPCPPSSTTRTAPAASRCSTTTTGRSATSWRPRAWRSATGSCRAPGRRSDPAMPWRCATSRSAPWCTTSSSRRAGAAAWAAAPEPACSLWPRRVASPPFACPARR